MISLKSEHDDKHDDHADGQVGVAESNVMLSLASHFDSLEAERCMAKMEMRRVKVIIIITFIIIIIRTIILTIFMVFITILRISCMFL